MNKAIKAVMITGMSITLAGCACPQKESYTGGAYEKERTAGSGISVSDGVCLTKAPEVETQVQAEPVVKEQPPAKKAEEVFNKQLRK